VSHRLPFVLGAFLVALLPAVARADDASVAKWAEHRVQEGLVKPLAQQQPRRFSRERPSPHERRVRITRATPVSDKSGHTFVTFAVDVRFGDSWVEDDIVGCVYQGSGSLFVKSGDAYRPAAFLLGKNLQPVPGVCEASPTARS
jgi:hypothetical protein